MTLHEAALVAVPMHGQHKLSNEGYRTRDGHLIEWFGRKLKDQGPVAVVSRPEPKILASRRRYSPQSIAENTLPISADVLRLPTLRDRQRWWVDSLPYYRRALPELQSPLVTWNPFLSLSSAWDTVLDSGQPIAFDLLDDWSIHYAFRGILGDVENAYRRLFEHATVVTANAEGTVELAKRFGRDDVVFLPNGCDPERFSTTSVASGSMTVGYVGKIGKRLDLDLIVGAMAALPEVNFVFAGPILDAEYRKPLSAAPNSRLLGDVHYEAVPELLQTFDVGWVPHRVGEGEVGGDIIKTYEYRAAGMPVVTTPVSGATKRGLDAVTVVPAAEQIEVFRAFSDQGPRVPRIATDLPQNVRWSGKADFILERLGLS